MLRHVLFATLLITLSTAQDNKLQENGLKQDQQRKPPLLYFGTRNSEFSQQNEIQPQFYSGQPYSSQLYNSRPQYLEPQYQAEGTIPGFQPQIVLYGPGGQGQPILINPGNPPGNFLIPQGPNIIVRNNPQDPQNRPGPVFPVAGYPKPAHIPPIEKDAEEIPTNPANVPPLPSEVNPVTKPARNKPEKLETFNEPNQPDQNLNVNKGHFPQINPETVNLQPGQRFFILNGDQLFSYPLEVQPQDQHNLPVFRYINAQPFPENPPKLLQTFAPQEQSQVAQENTAPAAVPNLIQRNSFTNSQVESKAQQPESQPKQTESQPQQFSQSDIDGTVKTPQQYFQNTIPVNLPEFYLNPQGYAIRQQASGPSIQQIQQFEGAQRITSKDEVIQPTAVGQFRFTPSEVPGQFSYKDDFENDAVVVDASFDVPTNFNERRGNVKAEESESTTLKPQQPIEKESEPSMAQAGPQATAIAGPGGVAGSAPRGTAIVGKGGLAVSSPQATAVAGTKDEEKKKKPVKKNT